MLGFNSWDEEDDFDRAFKNNSHIHAGMKQIDRPKPRTDYYHYSNPNSQGALICGYVPDYFDPKTESYHANYSDRLYQWDAKNYAKACNFAGGYEQIWAYKLPQLTQKQLFKFAKIILKLKSTPKHVRIIHYYNVATGYSCPVVEVICNKE